MEDMDIDDDEDDAEKEQYDSKRDSHFNVGGEGESSGGAENEIGNDISVDNELNEKLHSSTNVS